MNKHPECSVRCQGYRTTDFVCGQICELLAREPRSEFMEKPMSDYRTDGEFIADQAEKIRELAFQLKCGHSSLDARGIAMLDQHDIGARIEGLCKAWATAERQRDEFEAGMKAQGRETARLKKALTRIAAPHDCGCKPCVGRCLSQESLKITVDAMRDLADEALNTGATPRAHLRDHLKAGEY